jgi:hypothetical protein
MKPDDIVPVFTTTILDRDAKILNYNFVYAGHEVIVSTAIMAGDHRSIDIYCVYRGKERRFMLLFQPDWNGPPGIWVHNFPYGISIAFNRWGSAEETVIDPPLRFADMDGQRFELYMAHKKIASLNRAFIQIVAIPKNYGGPYTQPLYGSDQPSEAKP